MITSFKFMDIKLVKREMTLCSPLYSSAGLWPDQQIHAVCEQRQHNHPDRHAHPNIPSPVETCICGIHSLKTIPEAMQQNNYGGFLTRLVLWGKIIEGTQGYRSEYARAENIVPIPCSVNKNHGMGLYYFNAIFDMNYRQRLGSKILCQECFDNDYHYANGGYTQVPIPLSHIGMVLRMPVDYLMYEKHTELMEQYNKEQAEKRRLEAEEAKKKQEEINKGVVAAIMKPSPILGNIIPNTTSSYAPANTKISIPRKKGYPADPTDRRYYKILTKEYTEGQQKWRMWKKLRLSESHRSLLVRFKMYLVNSLLVPNANAKIMALHLYDHLQNSADEHQKFIKRNETYDEFDSICRMAMVTADLTEQRYVGVYERLAV